MMLLIKSYENVFSHHCKFSKLQNCFPLIWTFPISESSFSEHQLIPRKKGENRMCMNYIECVHGVYIYGYNNWKGLWNQVLKIRTNSNSNMYGLEKIKKKNELVIWF